MIHYIIIPLRARIVSRIIHGIIRYCNQVLYGETPCNPLNSILDLEEFGKLGQSRPDLITMVDSTYASPYLQQPIKYGIDLVIHSS